MLRVAFKFRTVNRRVHNKAERGSQAFHACAQLGNETVAQGVARRESQSVQQGAFIMSNPLGI